MASRSTSRSDDVKRASDVESTDEEVAPMTHPPSRQRSTYPTGTGTTDSSSSDSQNGDRLVQRGRRGVRRIIAAKDVDEATTAGAALLRLPRRLGSRHQLEEEGGQLDEEDDVSEGLQAAEGVSRRGRRRWGPPPAVAATSASGAIGAPHASEEEKHGGSGKSDETSPARNVRRAPSRKEIDTPEAETDAPIHSHSGQRALQDPGGNSPDQPWDMAMSLAPTRKVDPLRIIQQLITDSQEEETRVTIDSIREALKWDERFSDTHGDLGEFLRSYNTLFIISPTSDEVMLRMQYSSHRRPTNWKPKKNLLLKAKHFGAIAYSSVAESFDLEALRLIYKRRGLITRLDHEVLHVAYPCVFDLFLFSSGVCVWWGMNRGDHWIVEDDFLTDSYFTRYAIDKRHASEDINELFPVWCSYELSSVSIDTSERRALAMAKFEENLFFDHVTIPRDAASDVMTAVSFAMVAAAKVDYLELVTEKLRHNSMKLSMTPDSVDLLYDVRGLRKLAGEVRMYEMLAADVATQPEWFWERSFLQPFYDLTKEQYTVALRGTWFKARCDALCELLRTGDSHYYRLFTIKSDWILIFILVLDVCFLLFRLFLRFYWLED